MSIIGILLLPYCVGTMCSPVRKLFGEINVEGLLEYFEGLRIKSCPIYCSHTKRTSKAY